MASPIVHVRREAGKAERTVLAFNFINMGAQMVSPIEAGCLVFNRRLNMVGVVCNVARASVVCDQTIPRVKPVIILRINHNYRLLIGRGISQGTDIVDKTLSAAQVNDRL